MPASAGWKKSESATFVLRMGASFLLSAVATGVVYAGFRPSDGGDAVEVRVGGKAAPSPMGREPFGELPLSPTTTTAVPRPARPGQVVWAEKGDIWYHAAGTGKRRMLTADGESTDESLPRFRSSSRVTYLASATAAPAETALMEVDIRSGHRRTVRRLPGRVRAYDWATDGQTLAYYSQGPEAETTELHILTGTGRPVVRVVGEAPGRGAFVNYDEWRVDWAPGGQHVLLADTALDTSQDETLHVLHPDGTDALPPRSGTWARWSADGRTIYCLCAPPAAPHESRWQAIDVATGVMRPLLIEQGARPSVSPDGNTLAFDDGLDTPGVHVLDLKNPAARPRLLARGALAPVWLSSSRLAVTDTRPCRRGQDDCMAGGHGAMFESAGTASALDVESGRRTPLPPIVTDDADTYPASP
jgi:hypothetical protein